MDNTFDKFLGAFTQLDLITICLSLVLLAAAEPICRLLNRTDSLSTRVSMMRILNLLIIAAIITKVLLFEVNDYWPARIAQCLIVIYFAMISTQFLNYFILKRFGRTRKSKDKISIADTYSSRGLSLIVVVIVSLITIVSCLQILGLKSLLEAGGALGIIGLVLAMTQASWAPDIISGLIILNSRLCEEGDVIQFNMDGREVTSSVFRTKLFQTECLDLANNHRLMVRNAKLRDYGVQNLSRFASAKGLRERLLFNIDYQHSEQEVREMIERAFLEIDQSGSLREEQFAPELRLESTGDYALTWAVYYYIKEVKQLLRIKQEFRAYILAEANRSNISLATPILNNNQVIVQQK